MGGRAKTPISIAFGEVLRKLRLEKGLTQEGLGLEAGIERNFVSLIERGLNLPTIATLFKLAQALGIPPSRIVELLEKAVRSHGKR